MWTQVRLLLYLGPHCLPVYENKFEKFASIFSRQHKQTTFSDAGFLGISRVKDIKIRCVLVISLSLITEKIGLKSLQEYSAVDINRQHFQMKVFLAF